MTNSDEIERVAAAMRAIVATSTRRNSATGYFAAMYLGVTSEVQRGLADDMFTTPDRLVQLTCVFAQRYIDAWQLRETGGQPSGSWDLAFRACGDWRPTVLQHLLLGMNAHINLDLGIATAQVAAGTAISELRPDFDQINNVLAGLIDKIQSELSRVSPLYRFVGDVSGSIDSTVIRFSISRARADAWKQATFLASAEPDSAAKRIADQDRHVASLGAMIVRPGVVPSTGLLGLRITEMRSRRAIINLLATLAD